MFCVNKWVQAPTIDSCLPEGAWNVQSPKTLNSKFGEIGSGLLLKTILSKDNLLNVLFFKFNAYYRIR